jgi:hypothetical protein
MFIEDHSATIQRRGRVMHFRSTSSDCCEFIAMSKESATAMMRRQSR